MGFYPPPQLVYDAKRHGIDVRPVDVTVSAWDCTLEAEKLAQGVGPDPDARQPTPRSAEKLGFKQLGSDPDSGQPCIRRLTNVNEIGL